MTKHKLKGVPKDYESLPYGKQIEYRRTIETFKASAKRTWLSIKRQRASKAWKEFFAMFNPTEWYAQYEDGDFCRDDSIEVFYT